MTTLPAPAIAVSSPVVPVTPWWGGLIIAVAILLSTIFLLRPNASDNAG